MDGYLEEKIIKNGSRSLGTFPNDQIVKRLKIVKIGHVLCVHSLKYDYCIR